MSLSPTELARKLFPCLICCIVLSLIPQTLLAQREGEATQTSAPFSQLVESDVARSETPSAAEVFELGDFESSLTRVLSHPSAQKDIGLVDDQRKRLAEIQKAFQPRLNQLARQAQEAGGKGMLVDAIAAKIRKLNEEKTQAIQEELLPHQLQRIEQIANQLQLKRFGWARGLGFGKLGRSLKITETQTKELQEIQDDLRKQILEKTLELKQAARKKSLDVLSQKQRQQLDVLVGDMLKETLDDWQEYFQQRRVKR